MNYKKEIISIVEAFSMQPITLQVISDKTFQNYWDKKQACKEIKIEGIQVDSNKMCSYYVGYNFDGQKIFEYLVGSMNVNYGEPS